GTYSPTYGASFCTPCKDSMITRARGASSITDCVKEERTKQAVSIVHRIPLLLLIILPAFLAMNLLFIFTSCFCFYQEYQMSSPRAPKKTESTMRMEIGSSSCRIPRQDPQTSPDDEPAMATSHLVTITPHEEHTPSPPVITVTDETNPLLPLENGKDTF
ncbi:hypothetical protein N325_05211, partial [Colius striatus]